MSKTRKTDFVTAAEAGRWNQLYDDSIDAPGRGGRWALFQAYARKRVLSRLRLCVDLIESYDGKRVLDLACGGGHYGLIVSERDGKWVGMDISAHMLICAKRLMAQKDLMGHVVRGDVSHLPFARNSFDIIFAVGILSYFPNRALPGIVKQLPDLLRPGGYMILQTIRLDVFTWVRSRLPRWIPRPIRLPGPLYPRRAGVVPHQFGTTSIRLRKTISITKWGVLPFQTIYFFEKESRPQ